MSSGSSQINRIKCFLNEFDSATITRLHPISSARTHTHLLPTVWLRGLGQVNLRTSNACMYGCVCYYLCVTYSGGCRQSQHCIIMSHVLF